MSRPVHARPGGRHSRGLLRRFLETRGLRGGYRRRHPRVRLRTPDAVVLAGSYLRGPGSGAPAVVLAHGLLAHRRKPSYARLAEALTAHVHVLALDLRGHGQSRGRCTLGDLEALDVATGVAWLRSLGHRWVGAVGVSMGATSVLHATLAHRPRADAVVAVSAPSHLGTHDTDAMRRLADLWGTGWKRAALRLLLNVRLVAPGDWRRPPDPVEAAAGVPVPVLVVHGEDDRYFPLHQAEAVAAAAGDRGTLWREPAGFGHAEDGLTQEFAATLGRALETVARTGSFPPRAG